MKRLLELGRYALLGLGTIPEYLLFRLRRPPTIIILGMHRSGTSCITRMISLCGAHLGDKVLGASSSNVAGHWEDRVVLNINEEILSLSGGSWQRPPAGIRVNSLLKWKMRHLVCRRHRHGRIPAWKDPRTVLTFPAWKPLLGTYIPAAVFRHPMSVADSLRKRQNMPIEKGLTLWKDYNSRLLEIAGREAGIHWIDFDGGISHIAARVRSIVEDAGLVYKPSLIDYYDPSLRNCDTTASLKDHETNRIHETLKNAAYRG